MCIVCCSQNVIDGDLCEVFNSVDASKQKSIAEELEDRSANEVCCVLCLFLWIILVVLMLPAQ